MAVPGSAPPPYGPFFNLVDPVMVPDYDKVVSNPIALRCILNKVRNFEYGDVSEFEADVQLLHSNCETFNMGKPSAHFIAKSGELLIEAKQQIKALKKGSKSLSNLIATVGSGHGATGNYLFDK